MAGVNIGKRMQVSDLRSIWPREPDFSDWLATPDGLELIANDLGIEIEDPRREHRPGDFPCDIVGHAVGDENHIIVVENQFGRTDHDHLGKLLTYAAVNGAVTGIWISEHVSDDHRKVIDWLNDVTPTTVSLYLAQIKAYRIGDSPVAPQLDVVCRPNLQVKVERTAVASGASEADQERYRWRREIWEDILSYIAARRPPFRLQSPGKDAWSNIAVGRSGFHLALSLIPKRNCIGCELTVKPQGWKAEAFAQLMADRTAIEVEVGASLDWRELPAGQSARIILEAPINPRDPANRERVKIWMADQAIRFYRTFAPRVKRLTPPIGIIQDGDEVGDE